MPHQVRSSMKTDCSAGETPLPPHSPRGSFASQHRFRIRHSCQHGVLTWKCILLNCISSERTIPHFNTQLPRPLNWDPSKIARLQFGLHWRNNCMFTVYFHGNPSALCCKCQLLSCFIGHYFCFMEQFPNPGSPIVASLARPHRRRERADEHSMSRVIMEC